MSEYDSFTVNSKNPLARLAHRTRNKVALSLVKEKSCISLLDYGCGDGTFIKNLNDISPSSDIVGYEPYMQPELDVTDIKIYKKWDDVIHDVEVKTAFDKVTCFEVMEHFSVENQLAHLQNMRTILKNDGELYISVPIEKGFPSLIKNLRRMYNPLPWNEKIYTLKNIIHSLFGLKSKSLASIRLDNGYLPHMGFYFDDFEKVVQSMFEIKSIIYSPFPRLPYFFNSQVFFCLENKKL